MTTAGHSDSHVTKEGTQKLFDYWLYGMVKAASELGTTDLVLREIEEAAITRFVDGMRRDMEGARTPEEIVRRYLQVLDRDGVMDQRDVTIRVEGARLHVSVGKLCPYRTVCNWANAEEPLHRCFRAISLSQAIRSCSSNHYDGKLDHFGIPCEITLGPSRIEAD